MSMKLLQYYDPIMYLLVLSYNSLKILISEAYNITTILYCYILLGPNNNAKSEFPRFPDGPSIVQPTKTAANKLEGPYACKNRTFYDNHDGSCIQ